MCRVTVEICERSGPLPIAFAHRGARAHARDNTLPAFERALDLGSNGLESDAWITSDGVVVLDHDGRMGRWPRTRPLRSCRRRELPAHIPSLDELYQLCGSAYELSLDVKDTAAFDAIIRCAEAAGSAARLWLCHPDLEVLSGWRDRAGPARLVHSSRIDTILGYGERSTAGPATRARLGGYPLLARRLGVAAVNLRAPQWDAPALSEIHAAGMLALGWDANAEPVIDRLLRLGIDGFYSDDPELAMRAVRSYRASGS